MQPDNPMCVDDGGVSAGKVGGGVVLVCLVALVGLIVLLSAAGPGIGG